MQSFGTNFSTSVPLTISAEERRRHIYLAGKTGTGKSTLLLNLMLAETGGLCLLDPHGDLALSVADATAPEEANNTIYFDPLDPDFAIGFNPLESVPVPERHLITSGVVSSFKSIFGQSWGPRLEYILGNSIRLLLDVPNATMLHLPVLLAQGQYRTHCLRYSTDPFITYYWTQEFAGYSDKYRQEAIAPIQNKAGQFAANPALRAVLGQKSTLDIKDIMDSGRVLIVNLSKRMGAEPSHLLGALLANAFAHAAQGRATVPESERRDFTLYVDEFQNFATDSFSMILSEARKWRLNLVLANQFLGQLSDSLKDAVLGNVGSLGSFRVGSTDATLLSKELGIANSAVLTDVPNFQAWIKVIRDNIPSEPILVKTAPADPPIGGLDRVRDRTRSRYARKRSAVDADVDRIFRDAKSDRWP